MPRCAVLVLCLLAPAAPAAQPAIPVDYARDILPILQKYCIECHGPQKQRGKLRLDTREHALRVLAPGKAAQSELLRRVQLPADDPEVMPARGNRLSPAHLAILRRWIDQGAIWPKRVAVRHWAYIAPVRPPVPAVGNLSWPRHPLDRFILARLERARLTPAPPADPTTLVRRLYLDLTGLPPTPAQADDFLADPRPDAYERLVERLLASPAFGERLARPWLDLARYADSHGFQRDDLRDLWPYRDWVIRALNADLPFDRFSIAQLAGDLLPNGGEDERIATGFHRNAPTNVEAGSDPEETRVNQVLDRVNTTAAVWLGTTMECAQCHDHKYDPFSMRDYYGLFAFFNNTVLEADRANPRVPGSIRFLGPSLKLASGASTLVMRELPAPRTTRMFRRGDFRNPGEVATPATPAVLPPLPPGPRHRLALARWLVSRDNPLAARVHVNRLWAELFGRGIVATLDDFGIKGEPPSHPELLDWLAVAFMDNGWSTKQLLRALVTSATYRQSSSILADRRGRDPDNRLLSRGPRFRLPAETIRDSLLATAGLLHRTMGGPPIRPPQPDGLWTKVGGARVEYIVSPGAERHRRGIYVVWKRASPYPSFVTFDAGGRVACAVQRARSNTPLQALTLLNDPVSVEAARALVCRVLVEADSHDARLRHAFRLAVVRSPSAAEQAILRRLYQDQLEASRADPAAARRLAGDLPAGCSPESFAAWYAVATTVLNLDETITRE